MNRSKYIEYRVFWRFADNHDPNGWKPFGNPTQDLTVLLEIMTDSEYKPGQEWVGLNPITGEEEISYKIMQRTVTLSDYRNLDVSK